MPGICRRRLLGGAVALAAVELAGTACTGKTEPSTSARLSSVSIPEGDLADGGRRTVMLGPNPVELRRGPAGVTALMLRCTHTGCVVRWRPAENVYVCPCHDGRFGADGRVISGPPPLPLRAVPVARVADRFVVGA
jgi:cytochrome b6-f complex iron-sulfur subunit